MHTINIVFSSFCHSVLHSMYPLSFGFERMDTSYVQDSFGQKRETLQGAIAIRVEPTPQVCN